MSFYLPLSLFLILSIIKSSRNHLFLLYILYNALTISQLTFSNFWSRSLFQMKTLEPIRNGNISSQKVMGFVLRTLYFLVRIFVLANKELFYLFPSYSRFTRVRMKTDCNFCPHYKRDGDLQENDSLSSYIRIKLCCLALVALCLFTSVEWSETLIFCFFHCSACPWWTGRSCFISHNVLPGHGWAQRHDHEETCLYFCQSQTSQ